MTLCPCGSNHRFTQCCKPYITGKKRPLTAQALMRSRYTAYTRANIKYIQHTMRGQALEGFDPIEAKKWAQQATWQGLNILNTTAGNMGDTQGWVEFIATYTLSGQQHRLHEKSAFEHQHGQWFYIGQASSMLNTHCKHE